MVKLVYLAAVTLAFSGLSCPSVDRILSSAPYVEVTITASDSRVSLSDPVRLTVTATNQGKSRITLASVSSCYLSSVARVDHEWERVQEIRPCAQFGGPLPLDPGQSHTEFWDWYGSIASNDGTVYLSPGTYLVKGEAGEWTSRRGIEIEVVGE